MATIKLKHVNSFVDRHGRLRHYFRRSGGKAIPLLGMPGSAEFMAAYAEALEGASKRKGQSHAAGTVAAVVFSYLNTSAFHDLSEATRESAGECLRDLPPNMERSELLNWNAATSKKWWTRDVPRLAAHAFSCRASACSIACRCHWHQSGQSRSRHQATQAQQGWLDDLDRVRHRPLRGRTPHWYRGASGASPAGQYRSKGQRCDSYGSAARSRRAHRGEATEDGRGAQHPDLPPTPGNH